VSRHKFPMRCVSTAVLARAVEDQISGLNHAASPQRWGSITSPTIDTGGWRRFEINNKRGCPDLASEIGVSKSLRMPVGTINAPQIHAQREEEAPKTRPHPSPVTK